MRVKASITVMKLPMLQPGGFNRKIFWARTKYNKDWYSLIADLVKGHADVYPWIGVNPLTNVSLICTRASAGTPDYDNLVSSFKTPIDGLVRAGVFKDDKPSIVIHREYKCEKVPPGKGWIRIEIEGDL